MNRRGWFRWLARTVDGEIGILAHHEPLMAALATGTVEIETAEERVRSPHSSSPSRWRQARPDQPG